MFSVSVFHNTYVLYICIASPPLCTPSEVSVKPEWAPRPVDVDKLEELERKHQDRIPATPAQPDWTVKKMDAKKLGRLERQNKLDKMASFDRSAPDWADKRKSLG